MNIHDIALRIENPALLVSSDIPVLKELAKKYPYAQLFSLLYLKALAKDQSLELEDALGKHAYKITDRVRLYEVLHVKEEENNFVQELYEIATEALSEVEIITLEIQKQEVEEIIENTIVSEEIKRTNTVSKEIEETIVENIQENNEKELDLDIISNAISGVFEREFEPERILEKDNKSIVEAPINIPLEVDVETENTKISFKGSKQTFSKWLKIGNETVLSEKVENSAEKIIDNFIQEDPKISHLKKEFYSPIKQAKKSLDSENLQYTETLANILGIQGNYPKAILAYEQLCLTIPEKKTYFVQKIKELKEKLNS